MVPAAIFKVETSLDAVAAADDQRKQGNIEDGLGWKKYVTFAVTFTL